MEYNLFCTPNVKIGLKIEVMQDNRAIPFAFIVPAVPSKYRRV